MSAILMKLFDFEDDGYISYKVLIYSERMM
jgi:Ca2+-binding EF-hand superfamily protein